MLKDPTSAVSRIVDAKVAQALSPIQESQNANARNAEVANLERDFPGYRSLGESKEFQDWAYSAQGRSQDAQASSKEQPTSGKPQGLEGARQARTEAGGQGGTAPGTVLNGHDIVDLIIKNPEKYRSEAYQSMLREAAKAGFSIT
jgi:hypothetical protein